MLQGFPEGKQAGPRTRTGLKYHAHLLAWQPVSIRPLSLSLCSFVQKMLVSALLCSLLLIRERRPHWPKDSGSFLLEKQPNPGSSSASFGSTGKMIGSRQTTLKTIVGRDFQDGSERTQTCELWGFCCFASRNKLFKFSHWAFVDDHHFKF